MNPFFKYNIVIFWTCVFLWLCFCFFFPYPVSLHCTCCSTDIYCIEWFFSIDLICKKYMLQSQCGLSSALHHKRPSSNHNEARKLYRAALHSLIYYLTSILKSKEYLSIDSLFVGRISIIQESPFQAPRNS